MSMATRYPKSLWSFNPIPTGCVLYLPLWSPGLNGSAFKSVDPYRRECVVTGTTQSGEGRILDGDDLITHTASGWRGNDSAGTILIWFKTNTSATYQVLFGTSDTATTVRYIQLRTRITSGVLEVTQINDDAPADVLTASTDVTDNDWHLGGLKSSGSAFSISVDGVDEGALTVSDGANTGDWFADTSARDNFTIGALTYTSTILHFDGTIGEVWVGDVELSDAEILYYYNNSYPRRFV
ncbi:hypothetical protein LCGC14_1833730 [marine sediment metagenome]|uniref:LamG-like jellyroll fold domain-containing protein n=1 Tax=marine sediment metagenome TaxID=412755 RepID=A0A0F9H3H9_9ZZZZ